MLSFPLCEQGGDPRQIRLAYPDRIAKIGLVLGEDGDGVASTLDFLYLVQCEDVTAILADERGALLLVVSPA